MDAAPTVNTAKAGQPSIVTCSVIITHFPSGDAYQIAVSFEDQLFIFLTTPENTMVTVLLDSAPLDLKHWKDQKWSKHSGRGYHYFKNKLPHMICDKVQHIILTRFKENSL